MIRLSVFSSSTYVASLIFAKVSCHRYKVMYVFEFGFAFWAVDAIDIHMVSTYIWSDYQRLIPRS
jgi:hypothetical protein